MPGFGYAFFADQTGCCQEEAAAEGDLIVRDPSWTPREFETLYPPAMQLYQFAWTGMPAYGCRVRNNATPGSARTARTTSAWSGSAYWDHAYPTPGFRRGPAWWRKSDRSRWRT